MRVAVIGTGIAGSAAAWTQPKRYPVTVYDRELRPGGHSHTVTIDYEGMRLAVDIGFIVYNELNYPDLTASTVSERPITATAMDRRCAPGRSAAPPNAASISAAGGRCCSTIPACSAYTFNPLSVYFCYRADGELALVIYEVRNTFGGIHPYVLPVLPARSAMPACGRARKSCSTSRPSSRWRCATTFGCCRPGT
jgi:hypothetical protein